MTWHHIFVIVWLVVGLVFTVINPFTSLPEEVGPSVALSGALAYVIERTLSEIKLEKGVRSLTTQIENNTSQLERLSGAIETNFSDNVARIIDNVSDPKYWVEIESHFWVYNGLWTLPYEEFNEVFQFSIKKRGVKWRALLFAGDTSANIKTAAKRYECMRDAFLNWSKAINNLDSSIEVRVFNAPLPGSTFMLTQRGGKPLIRLYVDVLNESETPRISLEVRDANVAGMFRGKFDAAWGAAHSLKVSDVLECSTLDEALRKIPSFPYSSGSGQGMLAS